MKTIELLLTGRSRVSLLKGVELDLSAIMKEAHRMAKSGNSEISYLERLSKSLKGVYRKIRETVLEFKFGGSISKFLIYLGVTKKDYDRYIKKLKEDLEFNVRWIMLKSKYPDKEFDRKFLEREYVLSLKTLIQKSEVEYNKLLQKIA